MRAIESMAMWVYNMLTGDEIFDCMAETGKEHQKAIDKAKKEGTGYTPDAPIHVMQFATALEIIRNDLPSVSDYCDTLAENNYAEVVKEVLYFRRVRCHLEDNTRLLVSFPSHRFEGRKSLD